MKVYVYYNLHKKCWSIKALSGSSKGRVVAHADAVELMDCEFRVSEAGRQRVIREKRKNVHAGVAGTLVAMDGHKTKAGHASDQYMADWFSPRHVKVMEPFKHQVTYNPYIMQKFALKGGHWDKTDLRCRYVSKADHVMLGYKRDVHALGVYITNDMPHPIERKI
jgi:hypothetical protein